MEIIEQVRRWWRRQLRPTSCRECGIPLTEDNDSGFCGDEHWETWTVEHNP